MGLGCRPEGCLTMRTISTVAFVGVGSAFVLSASAPPYGMVAGLVRFGRMWYDEPTFILSHYMPIPPVTLETAAFMHGMSMLLILMMLGALLALPRAGLSLAARSPRLRAFLAKAA